MADSNTFSFFREALLYWYHENPRPLPWKETDDPYKIWLSEIILQQTQVIQGIPYYNRFVERYPTVQDLAAASEGEVLKEWQGLGYNSRARNLRAAAITVSEDYNGYFPNTYDGLLELNGIGPYTAAAIASFAFGENVPVIDANVIRILARFIGIEDNPSRKATRNQMIELLKEMMLGVGAADFNQAIMNFGALQCTPKTPKCSECPLNEQCYAFHAGKVQDLPKRPVRKPRRDRYFHYLVLTSDEGVVLKKRSDKDIWQGMHDFPFKELPANQQLSVADVREWVVATSGEHSIRIDPQTADSQVLTHQKIHCTFYPCHVKKIPKVSHNDNFFLAEFQNLSKLAVPKVIDSYFKAKSILLSYK